MKEDMEHRENMSFTKIRFLIFSGPDISPDLADNSMKKSASTSNDTGAKKPIFTVTLKDYTFVDGKPALLKCELDTSSDTDVIWYKDGRELPNNTEFTQKFDGKEAVLDILEVFPEDAGEYTCEAENDHGITKSTCTVKIIGKFMRTDTLSKLPQVTEQFLSLPNFISN